LGPVSALFKKKLVGFWFGKPRLKISGKFPVYLYLGGPQKEKVEKGKKASLL